VAARHLATQRGFCSVGPYSLMSAANTRATDAARSPRGQHAPQAPCHRRSRQKSRLLPASTQPGLRAANTRRRRHATGAAAKSHAFCRRQRSPVSARPTRAVGAVPPAQPPKVTPFAGVNAARSPRGQHAPQAPYHPRSRQKSRLLPASTQPGLRAASAAPIN
jgi:hypothetical protein